MSPRPADRERAAALPPGRARRIVGQGASHREDSGFVRTDLVSVAREEYRSRAGHDPVDREPRPTADGGVSRELWVAQDGWQRTRRLATIEGRPVWASHGEWFICQVESERPIKDQSMDRTVERIERFSADGRVRTMLAAGSNPLLHEARGEVFFTATWTIRARRSRPACSPSTWTGTLSDRYIPCPNGTGSGKRRRLFRPGPAADPLHAGQSDQPARLRDHGNPGADHGGSGRPVPGTPSQSDPGPRDPSRAGPGRQGRQMMRRWIPGWLALALAGAAVLAILPARQPRLLGRHLPPDPSRRRSHAYFTPRMWRVAMRTCRGATGSSRPAPSFGWRPWPFLCSRRRPPRSGTSAVRPGSRPSGAGRGALYRLPVHRLRTADATNRVLCRLRPGARLRPLHADPWGLAPGPAEGRRRSLALAVPLGSLLALLWRRYPGRWVLPAWGLGGLVASCLVALAPS